MSSRFGNTSAAKILSEIDKTIPANTKKSQNSIWKQFSDFCKERNFNLNCEQSVEDVAKILMDWGFNMKKRSGDEYKESVIKTIWNSTAKIIQNMYFEKFNVTFNPFADIVFKQARAARDSKRKQLQTIFEKRKESSVALTKEEINKMALLWDENTPIGLLKRFFHIVAYELAWRGGEAANCKIGYFKLEKSNAGTITGRIEYNTVFSKTCQGGSKKCCDTKWLIKDEINNALCPVRLFHKIIMHRSPHFTTDRLFLTPNPFWEKDNAKGWYKNTPIGINEILKWTRTSAEKIGLNTKEKKISNHSHRASAVSNLSKAGVNEQELIKITGHSSSTSIKPYLQIDKDHHSNLVENLRTSTSSVVSTSAVQKSSTGQTVFNNCSFNNCTFK